MRRGNVVAAEPDINELFRASPRVLSVADLLASEQPAPEMLIEGIVPMRGASLVVGWSKSGKTILAAQIAIAVASGTSLFGKHKVLKPGAVMMVEQDDPGAESSIKDILERSPVSVTGIPFCLVPKVPFQFGDQFIDWLEAEIRKRLLRLCVLDSYTALRGSRNNGVDIVKAEHQDLTQLDELAKRSNSGILVLHHTTAGKMSMHWTQQAGGTFAMGWRPRAKSMSHAFPNWTVVQNACYALAAVIREIPKWCCGFERTRWIMSNC